MGCLILTSCSKGIMHRANPILDTPGYADTAIRYINYGSSQRGMLQCGNYYLDRKSAPEFEKQCADLTNDIFKSLSNGGALPKHATIEDLRDPQLWKLVLTPEPPPCEKQN